MGAGGGTRALGYWEHDRALHRSPGGPEPAPGMGRGEGWVQFGLGGRFEARRPGFTASSLAGHAAPMNEIPQGRVLQDARRGDVAGVLDRTPRSPPRDRRVRSRTPATSPRRASWRTRPWGSRSSGRRSRRWRSASQRTGHERLGDELKGDPAAQAELNPALAHVVPVQAQVRGAVERAIVSSQ